MIVSDSETIMGRATAIQTDNFICKVNSVKQGLLVGGLVTMIYDLSSYGTYDKMPEKKDMIVLIKYLDSVNKATRLAAHGTICEMLNEWGGKGMCLKDIVSMLCEFLAEKNVISGCQFR